MTAPEGFKCGLCGDGGMTEAEAVAHTCGVPRPEPTLADEPMSVREAVTVLAVQLSGLTAVVGAIADNIQMLQGEVNGLAGQTARLADMLGGNDKYHPIYIQETER